MPQLLDLPNELLLIIIQYLLPYNEHRPIIGFDAGWRTLDDYRSSLTGIKVKVVEIEEDDKDANQIEEKTEESCYRSLTTLRLTCSSFKDLCSPALFHDFNIFRPLGTDSWLLLKYAHHARNVRILLDNITDLEAARIIDFCSDATSISLYHETFDPDTGEYTDDSVFWMKHLNQSIITRLEDGILNALGFYASEVLNDLDPINTRDNLEGPLPLLQAISNNEKSRASVKHLDVSIFTLQMEAYNIIRTRLPSLESLSFNYALRSPLVDPLWDTYALASQSRWANYSNLERIQFKICEQVYAGHISPLVRHLPALNYLMITTCGSRNDVRCPRPPEDWYSTKDALWKVHQALDVHIEHMFDWEIRAMADIPVKTLIVTNLRGDFLNKVLNEDSRYFPGLRTIRIQDDIPEYTDGAHPFTEQELSNLQTICEKRGLELRRDAKGMMLFPKHYY